MAVTIPQLKQAAAMVAESFGLEYNDAARIIGVYKGEAAPVLAILGGDLSGVPDVAALVGVHLSQKQKKTTPTGSHKSEAEKKSRGAGDGSRKSPKRGNAETRSAEPETVTGDIIPAGTTSPDLPADFADRIEGWLYDFAARYDLDLVKASGQQWRSACIYIGRHIQDSKVLRDAERERHEGGKIYKPERVAALVPIWEYLTGLYKHTPMTVDFCAFAGVSREWFYDSNGRGLTSRRVDIVQKVQAIETAGISIGLVDGRENPTGKIFYSKARLGWSEAPRVVEVVHSTAGAAGALPVFNSSGGGLIEEKPENTQ